jgi:hypothetical protein
MKNKILLIAIIVPAVLGCGIADRLEKAVSEGQSNNSSPTISKTNTNANKTLTDKAVDTAVGDQKIGIVECDEAMEMLAEQANDPNDNFVIKAGKKTALNMFREQLKKSLEENKTDKKKVADFCKDFRDNMQDAKSEENSNSTK